MDIFLNQLIRFYWNNATNRHHLTSHSAPRNHRLLYCHFTICVTANQSKEFQCCRSRCWQTQSNGRHKAWWHIGSSSSFQTSCIIKVSWSLTSLFRTNMAISETKGQGWKVIHTQW